MSHAQAFPGSVARLDRAHQSLGQIAVDLPGATAIFRGLKLDFCCGGQTPPAQACEDKHLSLPEVLDELTRLDRPASQAVPQSTEEMIDHIHLNKTKAFDGDLHVSTGLPRVGPPPAAAALALAAQ